jgi:hypothetical protein
VTLARPPSKREKKMLDMFEDLDPVNAVIESIVSDERWYGDTSPHWIIGAGKRWERPSKTAAEAREQREQTESNE